MYFGCNGGICCEFLVQDNKQNNTHTVHNRTPQNDKEPGINFQIPGPFMSPCLQIFCNSILIKLRS